VGETVYVATRYAGGTPRINPLAGGAWMTREDWRRSWAPWLRGTALGFPIGALPAGGSEIPTFLSYMVERRLARKPEEFGRGAIEGVAGPEAANNAAAAGVLVPLLTLGLPTSATAAILLGAFQNYGLQPGPFLFQNSPDLVWGLIASLYIGNVMLLILNLPLVSVWVRLLLIPRPYLYAGIMVFGIVGVYGLSSSELDLALMVLIGLVGYVMRVYDFPIAPVLIGLILGPMAETQLRRALAISQGSPAVLVETPLSIALWVLAGAVLLLPVLLRRLRAAT
jgi:putative tricarboxylic transport membrane protein